MIPRPDAPKLTARDAAGHWALRDAAKAVSVAMMQNTALRAARVTKVIETECGFFHHIAAHKRRLGMARMRSNRGWTVSGSEQVDPGAEPDRSFYVSFQ